MLDGRRAPVAGDLARPLGRVGVHDDQLGALDARPDALVDQARGDRVERATDRDRRLPAHLARLPEADRLRHRRQRVQPLALLSQHHRRRPARDPVLAHVHPLRELRAGELELRESA